VYKKKIYLIIFSFVLILFSQMVLFRIPTVFNLCLKTYLYDNAYWVKDKPKVLLMGSSRCYHNIIPSIIQKMCGFDLGEVVNLGNDGATPFEMLHTYKKNRHKFEKASDLFFVLDPRFFFESSFVDRIYEKKLLSRKQWSILSEKYGNFYFLPSVMFFNALRFIPTKNGDNMGFSGLPSHDFLAIEAKSNNTNHIYSNEDFPVSAFEIESLVDLKRMFEEDGGTFVLVLAPYWDVSKLSDDFLEQCETVVSELNDSLGPVRVIGSWHREKFGLDYQDFKDSSHLSLSGAEKFTSTLFSDIESIAAMSPDLIGDLRKY